MARRKKIALLKRALVVLLVLGGLSLAGWQAWAWRENVRCDRIVVAGAEHASRDSLLALAQVAKGDLLYAIDPAIAADRIRRHPWVASAEVSRLPTGTLRIQVCERKPLLAVLDENGNPSYYLDTDGYQMPLTPDSLYRVPFMRGLVEPYHPIGAIEDSTAHALLDAMAQAPVASMIAGFERLPEDAFLLHTKPTGRRASIPVRIGQRNFPEKLQRLRAFWQQAVITQPETQFEYVDLRFEGQIITSEHTYDRQ